MSDRLTEILEEISGLEKEIQQEIKRKEEEFEYKIRKGKVIFEDEVLKLQKAFSRPLFRYLMGARPLNVLTAPIIYALIIPAALVDSCIFLYQLICFPL